MLKFCVVSGGKIVATGEGETPAIAVFKAKAAWEKANPKLVWEQEIIHNGLTTQEVKP